jgi:hypothetical protein
MFVSRVEEVADPEREQTHNYGVSRTTREQQQLLDATAGGI